MESISGIEFSEAVSWKVFTPMNSGAGLALEQVKTSEICDENGCVGVIAK